MTLRGEESIQAGRVRRFAESARALGLPVKLHDERHITTEAAIRWARDLDAAAPAILLEDFLAQRPR